jgi:hypothetical protein
MFFDSDRNHWKNWSRIPLPSESRLSGNNQSNKQVMFLSTDYLKCKACNNDEKSPDTDTQALKHTG